MSSSRRMYEEFSRLEVLYPEDSTANADVEYVINLQTALATSNGLLTDPRRPGESIVLVAGLGGHYKTTWEASDRTLWPVHLLPRDIAGIRVLSFHYNTTLRGTTSSVKIRDHALELLDRLDLDRIGGRDESASLRPIIFVGHSLGGILIKQTLLSARDESRYHHLWDASRGVMFFATPHRGLGESAWPTFATEVLRMCAPAPGISPTKGMTERIRSNSQGLFEISEDFLDFYESLAFVNFTEGTMWNDLDHVLVDEVHGWMDASMAHQLKLEGDHIGICRFGRDAVDLGVFGVVSDEMKYLIEQSPKALDKIAEDAKRALRSLCPDGIHAYFMSKEPIQGTCGWIEERQEFQAWLGDDEDTQMLWISGPPSSGKSFVAKHIVSQILPSAKQEVAQCFLNESGPGRGNIEALLRATLHHALRFEPELIANFLVKPFLEAQNAETIVYDDDIWTRDVLAPMWPDVIATVSARRSLTLVVDGFDEMTRECRQDFLDCVTACYKKIPKPPNNGPGKLRILMVSRDSAENSQLAGQEKFKKYLMTSEDTLPDVARTVMTLLGHHPQLPSTDARVTDLSGEDEVSAAAGEMCEAIVDRARGSTFAWATGAAELARERTVNEGAEAGLKLIQDLPLDEAGPQRRILEEMHRRRKNTLPLVRQVLQWAVFQMEMLFEAELTIAGALGMILLEGSPGSSSRITPSELESRADSIKVEIDTYCGQVVEFPDRRLKLVYKNMKKILTEPGELSPELSYMYMSEGPSHAALASVCITYLTMSYFADSGIPLEAETTGPWQSKVRRRIRDHGFVRYAALHWFEHVETAGESMLDLGPELDQYRRLLQTPTTEYSKCWTEVWWFLRRGSSKGCPPGGGGCTADRVLQACGLASVPADPVVQVASAVPRSESPSPSMWKRTVDQVGIEPPGRRSTQVKAAKDVRIIESGNSSNEAHQQGPSDAEPIKPTPAYRKKQRKYTIEPGLIEETPTLIHQKTGDEQPVAGQQTVEPRKDDELVNSTSAGRKRKDDPPENKPPEEDRDRGGLIRRIIEGITGRRRARN